MSETGFSIHEKKIGESDPGSVLSDTWKKDELTFWVAESFRCADGSLAGICVMMGGVFPEIHPTKPVILTLGEEDVDRISTAMAKIRAKRRPDPA